MKKSLNRTSIFFKKRTVIAITTLLLVFGLFAILTLGNMRTFLPKIPAITGIPFQERNYLVIFQNNNELRPAGGFITSYGILKFHSGIYRGIEIHDVYGSIDDHEYLTPPYPMEELLANEWYQGYTFRDGNFNADFPTTAKELIRLFKITNPDARIDGVFAVNFSFIERLLDITGPVEIDEYVLSSQNLFETTTHQVNDVDRHNIEELESRKGILKPLASSLIKKLVFNPFNYRDISEYVTEGLNNKDIQLYFEDQSLQNFVNSHNWGGAWPYDLEGDFLAVVEANLGGMKSDRYIKRDVTYHVKITEEVLQGLASPEADLEVKIQHYGIENIPLSGHYTGYFRYYKNPDDKNPQDEIIKLKPGETKIINKSYTLPENVFKNGEYSLYIPKQSGTIGDQYTIIIELPQGYGIGSNDFVAKENIAYFEGALIKDLSLQLKLKDDVLPPLIIDQYISELGKISVHFNEDMDSNFLSDPLNYEVVDLDKNHPENTDSLQIENITTTARDVHIFVNGMTEQDEEHYGVTLKHLADKHGNVMKERQITIVQRYL
jgi:hypothetical protein